MKFLIDNHLPMLLAVNLRQRGHECEHVLDVGLDAAPDIDLWNRCARHAAILIGKDEDFVFLASRPGDVGRLIWVRLGNCRNVPLIEAFDRAHHQMLQAFQAGQRIIELR